MMKTVLALALLLPLVAQAGFDEGVEAYAQSDYAKALAEFKPLAEQGDPRAEYFMGFLYRYGYGVKMDHAEAGKWFRLAADHGDPRALYYLGKMYESGEGVQRDPIAAHSWFSLSAKYAPNPRDAAYTREEIKKLERKMTPEQIAKAKEMAAQWKPTKQSASDK
jgi:TPR repeat protein